MQVDMTGMTSAVNVLTVVAAIGTVSAIKFGVPFAKWAYAEVVSLFGRDVGPIEYEDERTPEFSQYAVDVLVANDGLGFEHAKTLDAIVARDYEEAQAMNESGVYAGAAGGVYHNPQAAYVDDGTTWSDEKGDFVLREQVSGASEYSSAVAGDGGYLGLSAQELDKEIEHDYEEAMQMELNRDVITIPADQEAAYWEQQNAVRNPDVDDVAAVEASEVQDIRQSADSADVGYHNEEDFYYDYASGRYYPLKG